MTALDLISPKSPLYQKRQGVYPKAVDGRFRRLKWLVMAVTLTIYYVTPWLRWDRGAHAPDQAVLVDLAHRRFYMFSIEIWPQEFYYVAGLLIMAGIGLFLVTSAVGRAWCGYACPQTVWTDLFQHVERWVDGDRNAQIKLARAPWTANKLGRRLGKWSLWLLIALATGGAWIFYFADAPTLAHDFVTGSAAPVAYMTVGVLTFTTFWLGGFMREQVCVYMCPWPRIQTAMLDEKSLLVTYKDWRGEPRSAGQKRAQFADVKTGDCIDCNGCVSVCPTGIDIRNGPQIGCITCGLCIDACDDVMAKLGKPRGLIDYVSFEDADRERAGGQARPVLKTVLRPRTIAYFGVWAAIGVAMLFTLGDRARLTLDAAQDRNPLFVQLSDGAVRNGYTIKFRNMETQPRTVAVELGGLPGAVMWTEAGTRNEAGRRLTVHLPADATTRVHLFVAAPGAGPEKTKYTIVAQPLDVAADSRAARPAAKVLTFDRPATGDAQ